MRGERPELCETNSSLHSSAGFKVDVHCAGGLEETAELYRYLKRTVGEIRRLVSGSKIGEVEVVEKEKEGAGGRVRRASTTTETLTELLKKKETLSKEEAAEVARLMSLKMGLSDGDGDGDNDSGSGSGAGGAVGLISLDEALSIHHPPPPSRVDSGGVGVDDNAFDHNSSVHDAKFEAMLDAKILNSSISQPSSSTSSVNFSMAKDVEPAVRKAMRNHEKLTEKLGGKVLGVTEGENAQG